MSTALLKRLSALFAYIPSRARPPLDTQLTGKSVVLRMATIRDWRTWRDLRESSRDFLVPWEPTWPPNVMSYGFFCNLLRRQWRDWRRGSAYAFLIFQKDGRKDILVGGINLNDVQFATAQKGTLGYWMGHHFTGKGYMTEAVNLVSEFAFQQLKLNRLEASCLPRNFASQKVLERCGFAEEGFARNYLRINGKWEDHLLWGKRNISEEA